MTNFKEFRLALIELTNYYGIPLKDITITGNCAKQLGLIFNDGKLKDKNIFKEKVAMFTSTNSSTKLREHFTTTCSKKAIVTFNSNTLEVVAFEQVGMLRINVIDGIKFLNSTALDEYTKVCPKRFKDY